jgi:hypothetical protein
MNTEQKPDLQAELKKMEGEEIFTRSDVRALMELARRPLES